MFENSSLSLDIQHALILNYGLIIDQEVIYASNDEFESILQIVNFSNSFVNNLNGGRLTKINHIYEDKAYSTLVRTKVIANNKNLLLILSGSYDVFPATFQQEIFSNFINEVESTFNTKRIEKTYRNDNTNFEIKMHGVVSKIDTGLALINEMEKSNDGFLVKPVSDLNTIIHYVGISTVGIPVRNRLYDDQLVSSFKIPTKEGMARDDTLRTLISAQFSAIVNSSLIKARTRIAEVQLEFVDPRTNELRKLIAAFFPIGYKNQYVLEICYEGMREVIEGFRKACNTMFTKFLQIKFKGNLKDFEFVADILEKLPEKFDLFGKNLGEDTTVDGDIGESDGAGESSRSAGDGNGAGDAGGNGRDGGNDDADDNGRPDDAGGNDGAPGAGSGDNSSLTLNFDDLN
ncbi:MAG: hypothetical protein ACTSUE_07050 [Promethearchaeota archaeon]